MKLCCPKSLIGLCLLILLMAGQTARSQVLITEFMASNNSTLADENGDFSDWIELHNAGISTVNLNGWFLTDNAANLTKWRLPSTNVPPGGFLVVFASGKNRATPGLPLHTSFSLAAAGEYLGLIQPNGTTVASDYAPMFPEQFTDISYGLVDGQAFYFSTPTPGSANSTNHFAKAEEVKFSVSRGFYESSFALTLSTDTPGATIRFTTNGSPPSGTNGTVYAAPLLITNTTALRAAAFKTGFQPSKIATHTYIFVSDVIRQSTNGVAPPGWPATWGTNVVDYGMDPDIVNHPAYRDSITNDLKALPTISIVMKLEDLFDRWTGIYANPGQKGSAWERPTSVEMIHPDGTKGFHVNAGIRIRGGFSRSGSNPKHSFRLFFREEYGNSRLNYAFFGNSGASVFDNIDLATWQNHSWSFSLGTNGLFFRDHFCRDTQLAMGHQGERGIFCHLYINGQYWGIFSPSERTEAAYGASYFGGSKSDYDVIKATGPPSYLIESTDGDMEAWTRLWQMATNGFASDAAYQQAQGNNPDGTRNPAYEVLLDVPNLIDYMLIVLYGGSRDGPLGAAGTIPNNFFALRKRDNSMGFQFFVHDFEHTLLATNENRTGPYTAGSPSGGGLMRSNPQYLWQQLQQNENFRMRVADHVHRHFFNGGLLTPQACIARAAARTNQLYSPLVAESARWGDAQRTVPYNRNVDWLANVNLTFTNYFPQRSGIVLNQLRGKGLYPTVTAPSFNQHGGEIDAGFALAMTAPTGLIYYTLDGSDPRLPGGGVAPAALVYSGPVTLNESVLVKSRALDNGVWSALNEAAFLVRQTFAELFITELMYHPPAAGETDGDEFEFIELKNVGSQDLDLGGVHFTDGITYTFPFGTALGPGQFILLASNPTQFAAKYPGIPVFGSYLGRLSNGGERVRLSHATGATIFSVTYSDTAPWPGAADGQGFSLVPANPNLNSNPDAPASWRASAQAGGSPGADDPSPGIAPILINEILTHTDLPLVDAVELFNPTGSNANIGHWFLTDSRTSPKKYQLPANTIIPAGGYLVLTENYFNPIPVVDPSFSFSSHGEEVYIYSADADGNLTGYSHGFSFGAAANGVSFGRHVISTGEAHYPAQASRTLGAPNSGPLIGPVVINELRYRPPAGDAEFVEIKNITSATVKLYDPGFPTNRWQLNGLAYTFPQGAELPPNGLALVVESDPSVFRSRHNVPAQVQIFGPFSGTLQDNGERIQLQRPDSPDVTTNGVIVPYITVDEVRYDNKAPWPASAALSGASLERINAAAYGNDPANWRARNYGASPGFENSHNVAPLVDAGANRTVAAGVFPFAISLEGTALDDGFPGPLSVSWEQISGPAPVYFFNGADPRTVARFPQTGVYALRLTASDGAFTSSNQVQITVTRQTHDETLISPGSNWKYLDNGSDLGTAWRQVNFDDSAWAAGPAQLGYGDGDEATVVSFGPNAGNKHITTYFRRAVVIPEAAAVTNLIVKLLRDDGGVVYINGTEVFRSNMPQGPVTYQTVASSVVGPVDENTFFEQAVSPSVLTNGTNIIAAEIHQATADSTDLSFDLELAATTFGTNQPPTVSIGENVSVILPHPALLSADAVDDGLPLVPGKLTYAWSRVSGPGSVEFSAPNALATTATFSAPGEYILRLTAHDGVYSTQDEITVTALPETFDSWMGFYFTQSELANPALGGADSDADGDRFTNWQEYLAGTNPRDPQSALRIHSAEISGGVLQLAFQGAARRSYTLQRSGSMQNGSWTNWLSISQAETNRWITVTNAVEPGAFFYRLTAP